MSSGNKVKRLLQWCTTNSVFIDPRIQVRLQDTADSECHADIGVFSMASFIPPHTTLARIPKEAILSVRTSSLAKYIPVVSYGIGAQLSLTIALYVEILRHERSRWHCYFQSLPEVPVDLPLFWGKTVETTGSSDCVEALLWLTGTEAAKILNSNTENGSSVLVEITNFFNDVAEPLLRTHSYVWLKSNSCQRPTIEGFYHAFSLVSSRAFLVDTYHGLSIVPIADAFNHTVENHVHMESDYLVCPECGSLRECAHDWDELRTSNFSLPLDHHGHDGHDNCYEIVSNTGIAPNSEVFNTYGETLTNSQLLNQYGFVLDVNDNDRLLWSAQEIFDMSADGETTGERFKTAIFKAGDVLLGSLLDLSLFFDQSQLICLEPDVEHRLYLNDEGKISAGLWALFIAFAVSSIHITDAVIDLGKLLTEIVDIQLRMESISEEGVNTISETSLASDIVLQTARSVVNLCDRRKGKGGKPNSFDCDLSDLLEQIPRCHRRTRLAISVILTERSILDACHAGWSSLITSQCQPWRGVCPNLSSS